MSHRRFPSKDKHITHLLMAQAQIPATELPEMAGFARETLGNSGDGNSPSKWKYREPRFAGREIEVLSQSDQADQKSILMRSEKWGKEPPSVKPDVLPHGVSGFPNEPIRGVVLLRLNAIQDYVKQFRDLFPEEYAERKFITSEMVGAAIAEFEFHLTFVNAPIDEFATGNSSAMSDEQKKGAILFFGKARCVDCHAVAGKANGMFSDFENHVAGIPRIAPAEQEAGGIIGNVAFAGPGSNEDYGLEDITRNSSDRYKFRTSPLRNLQLQPTFGHNGAWAGGKPGLEAIVRHHLNPNSARTYDPSKAGVAKDLQHNVGPIEPVLARLSPKLATPIHLSEVEFADLICFLWDGLHDPRATSDRLFKSGSYGVSGRWPEEGRNSRF